MKPRKKKYGFDDDCLRYQTIMNSTQNQKNHYFNAFDHVINLLNMFNI
jgi:hypothetical protein